MSQPSTAPHHDRRTATDTSDPASQRTVIRLYLIRHGETVDNVNGIVVGQYDSPLTELGMLQARALGLYCEWLRPCHKFHEIHVSDLPRTQHTANIILNAMSSSNSNATSDKILPKKFECMSGKSTPIFLDPRLREVAKGARQGFPKSTTYEEALAKRRNQANVPKLESYDQVWDRWYSWLYDVMWKAVRDAENNEERHILAVSHADSLRVVLQHLVPESHPLLHPSAIPEHSSQPRADSERFPVPNTSLTILELSVPGGMEKDTRLWPDVKPDLPTETEPSKLWSTNVIELTWTGHFDRLEDVTKQKEIGTDGTA